MENRKTIIIGEEYNIQLIEDLENILLLKGAILTNKIEGIAGSQDYKSYKANLNGSIIEIEIETYIGVSITGEDSILDHIEKLIKSR